MKRPCRTRLTRAGRRRATTPFLVAYLDTQRHPCMHALTRRATITNNQPECDSVCAQGRPPCSCWRTPPPTPPAYPVPLPTHPSASTFPLPTHVDCAGVSSHQHPPLPILPAPLCSARPCPPLPQGDRSKPAFVVEKVPCDSFFTIFDPPAVRGQGGKPEMCVIGG